MGVKPSVPRGRATSRGWLRLLVLVALIPGALSGCRFGPQKLQATRIAYNQALRYTEDEQMLLNLVRLRYREPIKFLGVGSISSQFSLGYDLEARQNIQNEDPEDPGGRAAVGYSDKPTLTFTPREGQEFTRRLLSPVDLETIQQLAGSEWSLARVLMMTTMKINGIDNATNASIATPPYPPNFEQFRELALVMRDLQKADIIELTYEDRLAPVTESVVHEKVSPSEMLEAEEKGYDFVPGPKGKGYVLARRDRDSVVRVKPGHHEDEDVRRMVRILELEPGLDYYDLEVAAEGHLKPDDGRARDTIWITPRSIIGTMNYLSQGVEVPRQHFDEGLVMRTRDASGGEFDFTTVTGDTFQVRSSKEEPRGAQYRVRYRGWWYYIPDSDVSTRTTFALLSELFELVISGGGIGQSPVLTLSAG